MIDIEAADVTVPRPAEVVSLDIMISHCADRRWPRDETVLVEVTAVIVEVADETELAGVAFPNQVLSKNIGDVNLLVPRVELIQIGKSIFLQHLEGGDVVLPAVVVVVPKNAHAQIGIVENKTAKIADEGLNAGAR